MKKNNDQLEKASERRKQAEEIAGSKTAQLQESHKALSREETSRLLHELQVHQIELEMQNAEHRRAQEELELSRNNYLDLYDSEPVGYFTFDTQGLILEVNLTGAKLLGTERKLLIKKPLSNLIATSEKKIFFQNTAKRFFKNRMPHQPVKFN